MSVNETSVLPLHAFRFKLSFEPQHPFELGADELIGAFSECSGLEATMEPKVIKAGGQNYGAQYRAGPVTFSTVVLKRGISRQGWLFDWFNRVSTNDPGCRVDVNITLEDLKGDAIYTWNLARAMPIKYKAADFNAKATDVGIEELHLVHEGLSFKLSKNDAIVSKKEPS